MKVSLVATLAVATVTILSSFPASAQQITYAPKPTHNPGIDQPCGNEFGHMKRVFPAQVAGIDDRTQVWVTPICGGTEMGMLRSEGNAEYLRPTIRANDVLVDVLHDHDYRAEDVFAVRMMGDHTINLYVHRFGS